MKAKRPVDKPSAQAVFRQAEAHFQAAAVLGANALSAIQMKRPTLLFTPMFVLQAFSLELFLKCLIFLESDEYPFGHNLEELFGLAKPDSRANIKSSSEPELSRMATAIASALEQDKKDGILDGQAPPEPSFEYALARSRRAFEGIRYLHEKANPAQDEAWFGEPILMSVRNRIVFLRPDLVPGTL